MLLHTVSIAMVFKCYDTVCHPHNVLVCGCFCSRHAVLFWRHVQSAASPQKPQLHTRNQLAWTCCWTQRQAGEEHEPRRPPQTVSKLECVPKFEAQTQQFDRLRRAASWEWNPRVLKCPARGQASKVSVATVWSLVLAPGAGGEAGEAALWACAFGAGVLQLHAGTPAAVPATEASCSSCTREKHAIG